MKSTKLALPEKLIGQLLNLKKCNIDYHTQLHRQMALKALTEYLISDKFRFDELLVKVSFIAAQWIAHNLLVPSKRQFLRQQIISIMRQK